MKTKNIFIIAEVGNLHNGSLSLAKKLIKEASVCGADAVKFQTHIFDKESLGNAPNPPYFNRETREQYFKRTAFSFKQWRNLKQYAEKQCKIEFISSVFSCEALGLLEKVGVKRHKVPSGEVTNLPLLEKIAKTKKPVLLSSGMSSWRELDNAVKTLKVGGSKEITVFQCSSYYPCPLEKVGLNILSRLRERYGFPVGLSDHTLGVSASIAAIMMGAQAIEKHFTLSKNMYGSDAAHSLEPKEFKAFVKEIRDTQILLSLKIDKNKLARDLRRMKIIFEKSLVSRKFIPKGTKITMDLLAFKKPGNGIRADRYRAILGKVARIDIKADTQLKQEMII
jgi:N,N'-diacetyllegionaminate synthase